MKKLSKISSVVGLSLLSIPAFAQKSFKQEISNFLDDYMLPVCGGMLLLGLVMAIIKNFDAINDANSAGRRKEGLVNLGMFLLYVFIGVTIIGLAAFKISKLSFKI